MRAAGLLLAIGLSACTSVAAPLTRTALACPAGQETLRTAQLFFARSAGEKPDFSEADFRAFMERELTPRFPRGLTVVEGGGPWRGDENRLIRDSAKIVQIVLPPNGDAQALQAARSAWSEAYGREPVLLIAQPSCISF